MLQKHIFPTHDFPLPPRGGDASLRRHDNRHTAPCRLSATTTPQLPFPLPPFRDNHSTASIPTYRCHRCNHSTTPIPRCRCPPCHCHRSNAGMRCLLLPPEMHPIYDKSFSLKAEFWGFWARGAAFFCKIFARVATFC